MKNNWKSCMVGEHVQLFQGLAINSKTKHLLQKKGTPLLRITDLINNTFSQFVDSSKVPQQCIAQEHDLIYTRTGQVGLIFKGRKGVIHNNCFKIVPDKKITRDYLYWYFRQEYIKDYAYSIASGSVQKDLNHSAFKSIEITIPPIKIQRGISFILTTLDDKIALLRRQNETLEAMAQALFKSWFVDFDPVLDRALAAGHALPAPLQERAARRRAVRENPSYSPLPDELLQLFPDRLVFSEGLGKWVPMGWAVEKIGAIASNIRNNIRANEVDSFERYIGLQDIPRQSLSLYSWSDPSDIASNKSAFERGDILFGKLRPYFHKVVVAPFTGICSTDILVIRPKTLEYFGILTGYLSSKSLIDHVSALSTGTRMPRTKWSDLSNYNFPCPPRPLAKTLSEIYKNHLDRIHANISLIQTLTQLRDTLLPKLISGELSVADFPEGLLAEAGS